MSTVQPPGKPAVPPGGKPVGGKEKGTLFGKLINKVTNTKKSGTDKIAEVLKGISQSTPSGSIGAIKEKLQASATAKAESADILNEWNEALKDNDPSLVTQFLEKESVATLLSKKYEGGKNLLQLACLQGKDKIVKAILEKATVEDLKTKDNLGRTVLHSVFANGHMQDIDTLTNIVGHFTEFCSHDPNRYKELFLAQDIDRKTPLSHATGHTKDIADKFRKDYKMWLG